MKKNIHRFICLLSLSLLSLPLAWTASDTIEGLSDAVFLPLIEVVRPLFIKLNFVIGGIFGATVLLVIVRIYYENKTIRLLKAIKFDLDQQNKRQGISYSQQRKYFYQRILEFLEDRAHKKALKQLYQLRAAKNENKHKARSV
ncbi:MAG TPA: hypothetical protein VJH68_04225 [Candidatus Nanoarchaeia archaeon]|nr:hypothetical protein [Candidatus Naiadarchaeales archaeon SRR2090153.bin461]HLC81840.1 hypothetical protein [Candidatus Nanoarchaeia archaeon]